MALALVSHRARSWCSFLSPLGALCLCGVLARANPPAASYIFPAGGQRGTTVPIRVGGLFLYKSCGFELVGGGVSASPQLKRTATLWFEGPLLPLPDSQRQEDYPKDMAGAVQVAADAALGLRMGRIWTAEGAAGGLRFEVGDLPEIIEQEVDGDPIPVAINLPVTINGRVFPREDIDAWSFPAKKGQSVTCVARAARLNSPLDPHLEIHDSRGQLLAESVDAGRADVLARFTAPADGTYQVRLRDSSFQGGPAYVYRLTVTADPYVDRVYPLGGQRGVSTQFELAGTALPTGPVAVAIPANAPRDFAYRHPHATRATNLVFLDVDSFPELREAEPNDAPASARPVTVPAVANGRIDRPGDVDCWSVSLKKGEPLTVEVHASQLGSPLRGVLTIADKAGKELTRAEMSGTAEPSLSFTPPTDGIYIVSLAERFKARGGPAFAYRLRFAPPVKEPGFRLKLKADQLSLPRGGTARFSLDVERLGGFQAPITLTVDGLPPGVTASGTVAQNQATGNIDFKVDKSAPVRSALLTVRGSATFAGRTLATTATLPTLPGELPVATIRAAVALPCPFKVVADFDMKLWSRGTVCRRKYRIERNGFDGPIEVSLADKQARHLQGASGPTLVVAPGVNDFEYPIFLPPWMETGRTSRVCVQAVGVVKSGMDEHEVCYSAIGQNDQLIAVIETGRLDVVLEKSSLLIAPGKSVAVPLRVSRSKGLAGPAKVELVLADHIRGISAQPITLAHDQSVGTLTLRFAATGIGPLNMAALVRATVMEPTGPVVGEAKLELLEPE